MIDMEKVAKRISSLRKERGYTGEALAERLQVSPQAVSKWENAKCLPETAILPALAEALDCSIDNLLCPRELFILEAVYTDGQTQIPVTRFLNGMVRDNALNICVSAAFIGVTLESDRLKLLLVKYQTSQGIRFSYALENETLLLDRKSDFFENGPAFQIIGAYYGNEKEFSSVMHKMEHYAYFNWDKIMVNHENFPSSTASDDTEYLTLVYLNADGIHAISCPENDALYYGNHRTQLVLQDNTRQILGGIPRLSFGEGMDCPWAGALHAALAYMGEPYDYHQIMGMSGACYRTCFTDVWDYSCTDALVAFDYATPFYNAIGYGFRMAQRLEKQERKAERQAIMEDIRSGRPVLAINLRVAPEWGVITGYTDNGRRFLCRTYFDALEQADDQSMADNQKVEERRIVFEENEGYLFNDFWPFLILHFGEKMDRPSQADVLRGSLTTAVESFRAQDCGGYRQGKAAYEAWMAGLSRESDFNLDRDRENVLRRLDVNDMMLCCLIDARSAAARYLRESLSMIPEREQALLAKMAENYQQISDTFAAFRRKISESSTCAISYNTVNAFAVSTPKLRREQAALLGNALRLEEECCQLAESILELPKDWR